MEAGGLAPASLLCNFRDNGLEVLATAGARLMGLMLTTRESWHDRAQEKVNSKLSDNKGQTTLDTALLHKALGIRIRKMLVIGNYI